MNLTDVPSLFSAEAKAHVVGHAIEAAHLLVFVDVHDALGGKVLPSDGDWRAGPRAGWVVAQGAFVESNVDVHERDERGFLGGKERTCIVGRRVGLSLAAANALSSGRVRPYDALARQRLIQGRDPHDTLELVVVGCGRGGRRDGGRRDPRVDVAGGLASSSVDGDR